MLGYVQFDLLFISIFVLSAHGPTCQLYLLYFKINRNKILKVQSLQKYSSFHLTFFAWFVNRNQFGEFFSHFNYYLIEKFSNIVNITFSWKMLYTIMLDISRKCISSIISCMTFRIYFLTFSYIYSIFDSNSMNSIL